MQKKTKQKLYPKRSGCLSPRDESREQSRSHATLSHIAKKTESMEKSILSVQYICFISAIFHTRPSRQTENVIQKIPRGVEKDTFPAPVGMNTLL